MEEKLSSDAGDLQLGELAAMAHRAVVTLAALVFECNYLRCFHLSDDFGRDRAFTKSAIIGEQSCLRELRFGAEIEREFFNFDHVACGDFVLLAAGFDNCVCHKSVN